MRGFALTLGVSVVLDLFVVYFFKRPTVFLLARNAKLVSPRGSGSTSGSPDRGRPRRSRAVNLRHAIAIYRGHRSRTSVVERRNRWFAISGIVVLSIVGMFFRQFNLSIDFEGGRQITYTFATPVDRGGRAGDARGARDLDAEVQVVNGDTISIRAPTLTGEGVSATARIRADLAEQAGIDPPSRSPSRTSGRPGVGRSPERP